MGREWITNIAKEIDFVKIFAAPNQVNSINTTSPKLPQQQQEQLNQFLEEFKNMFSNVAGKLKGPPSKVHLKPDATPIFVRAREVPLALKDAYINEIDSKIKSGLYKKVEYSEWASATHVVTKKGGAIRITGNYKPTVNPRIIIDEHPIPKLEDLLKKIRGSTIFCHLDVTDAYSHLTIDDEFAHVLTLNTPTHGLIRLTRAVYGAANIPTNTLKQ
ncbi:uncharacterized protein K02A2.6-like [Lucilia sericata]|uniref:uncharacterized protein K02A2.6-like n=1 Tax=Lucilia sericata TaxID=13632 RepID=UPI0018A84B4D|nr:uncharacterized protein K02A2.6-like [Lucilia sericata]